MPLLHVRVFCFMDEPIERKCVVQMLALCLVIRELAHRNPMFPCVEFTVHKKRGSQQTTPCRQAEKMNYPNRKTKHLKHDRANIVFVQKI